MRQRRVSLDVLVFSLLIIDQYPNNKKQSKFKLDLMQGWTVIAQRRELRMEQTHILWSHGSRQSWMAHDHEVMLRTNALPTAVELEIMTYWY
jgi:hypothetical protein